MPYKAVGLIARVPKTTSEAILPFSELWKSVDMRRVTHSTPLLSILWFDSALSDLLEDFGLGVIVDEGW